MRLRSALMFLLCTLLISSHASAQTCPAVMQSARRLVLVTVRNLASSAATLRLFARERPEAGWTRIGSAEPVNIGTRGVAWGPAFRAFAADGDPIKVEGDKRSPAGFYSIGRPFGFTPSPLARYLRLRRDHVCVEDSASPAYNTITTIKAAGRSASSEDMGVMPRYRRGLIIDYPTDAASKAGSCIFIHIWKGPARSTEGCLTLPEHRVAALQTFADRHATVLALVPQRALGKFGDCLPAAQNAEQPERRRAPTSNSSHRSLRGNS
jgi:L,D-peptidoglycan transpeptidase YkuD (ErfK/YbiS/YcfS/YnhG family)